MSKRSGRISAVAEQERLFGNGPGSTLPEICMKLRLGTSGAAEEWQSKDVDECLAMLKVRLKYWQPSAYLPARKFDEAVRRLLVATIEEVSNKQAGAT